MNCNELTTFLQKVLDNRDLIFEPKDGQLEETVELKDEIEKVVEENTPYNRNLRLRVELSERLKLNYVGDFHDGWAVATNRRNKWVFVDKEGDFLTHAEGDIWEFDDADQFSEGVAAVEVDGHIRYITTSGIFFSGTYSKGSANLAFRRFSNGVARVDIEDTQKYFHKRDGSPLINLGDAYSYVGKMSAEGLARFVKKTTDKQGFLDKRGREWARLPVFSENILAVTAFSEGYAAIRHKNITDSKTWWSFIDSIGNFYNNVLKEIHLDGEEIEVMDSLDCGWFMCIFKGGRQYGYVNLNGEFLKSEDSKDRFEGAFHFYEGLARVFVTNDQNRHVTRFINTRGKYLRDEDDNILEFTKATDFNDGLANVIFDNGDQYYLTKTGDLIRFG